MKCWVGWITGIKIAGRNIKFPQICRWYHPNGRKQRGTKETPDEGERGEWKASLKLNMWRGEYSFQERGGREWGPESYVVDGTLGLHRKEDGECTAGVCDWICIWNLASTEEVFTGTAWAEEDGPQQGWWVAQVTHSHGKSPSHSCLHLQEQVLCVSWRIPQALSLWSGSSNSKTLDYQRLTLGSIK